MRSYPKTESSIMLNEIFQFHQKSKAVHIVDIEIKIFSSSQTSQTFVYITIKIHFNVHIHLYTLICVCINLTLYTCTYELVIVYIKFDTFSSGSRYRWLRIWHCSWFPIDTYGPFSKVVYVDRAKHCFILQIVLFTEQSLNQKKR